MPQFWFFFFKEPSSKTILPASQEKIENLGLTHMHNTARHHLPFILTCCCSMGPPKKDKCKFQYIWRMEKGRKPISVPVTWLINNVILWLRNKVTRNVIFFGEKLTLFFNTGQDFLPMLYHKLQIDIIKTAVPVIQWLVIGSKHKMELAHGRSCLQLFRTIV